MARDKRVRAASRPSPVVADRGETGAHHAARLATRATGRGKRHRMQARTASRSRFNGDHNTASHNKLHTGRGSTAERHRRAGLGFHGADYSFAVERHRSRLRCPRLRQRPDRRTPLSYSRREEVLWLKPPPEVSTPAAFADGTIRGGG